jgi:hypothetical protein
MIVVDYKHGMRASEVRLDDLDMKNGSIVVDRLKGSLRTTQALTEHRGEPLLKLSPSGYGLSERTADGSDYLFCSQREGASTARSSFAYFARSRSKQ